MKAIMTKTRLTEIDLLRFAAAVAVVIFHLAFRGAAADGLSTFSYPAIAEAAKYGYLGVDLFFMISGFVILMSAASGGLRSFAESRVTRLYPAFWCCCSLTYISGLVSGQAAFQVSWWEFLANMTMLGDFLGVRRVDGSYWSLFVEIKFYLWVAGVLALGLMVQVERILYGWLMVTVALLIVPSYRLQSIFLTDYAAYFIAGAMFYLGWSRGFTWRIWLAIAGTCVMAMYQSIGRARELDAHYGTSLNDQIICLAIGLFFGVFALIALRKTAWIARVNWQTVGLLTYPLYLIHQNIGYMILNALGTQFGTLGTFTLVVLSLVVASVIINRWFERPVAAAIKRFFRRFEPLTN